MLAYVIFDWSTQSLDLGSQINGIGFPDTLFPPLCLSNTFCLPLPFYPLHDNFHHNCWNQSTIHFLHQNFCSILQGETWQAQIQLQRVVQGNHPILEWPYECVTGDITEPTSMEPHALANWKANLHLAYAFLASSISPAKHPFINIKKGLDVNWTTHKDHSHLY